MFEYLLSGLDPAPTPLQWINPFTLALLSYQETEAPDDYTISVRYPDGRVFHDAESRPDGRIPKSGTLSATWPALKNSTT